MEQRAARVGGNGDHKMVEESRKRLAVGATLARLDERIESLNDNVARLDADIRATKQLVEARFTQQLELTDNRFLWTILTVLASNVLPLVFHAAKLI